LPAEPDPPVDAAVLSSLREQLGAEDPVYGRILGLYLRELPGRMEAIGGAVARGDADALRDAAHSLRGSSATLGATLAAGLSEQLESAARTGELASAPVLFERLEDAARRTAAVFEAEVEESQA
jgi:histidine phosphotransfer protein HptB